MSGSMGCPGPRAWCCATWPTPTRRSARPCPRTRRPRSSSTSSNGSASWSARSTPASSTSGSGSATRPATSPRPRTRGRPRSPPTPGPSGVLVGSALSRRVELPALGHYTELGELDGEYGWDADAWADAVEPYFEVHDEIGTSADARGPALLIIDVQPGRWVVRQIFDDPAGDHDWGISAEVDLAASDEAGVAVLRVSAVGQLDRKSTRLNSSHL